MASSFGGINTALTSLYAQRRALDVTGQNIANANTEGYTRQRVQMQSQVGSISPAMYATTDGLGTGVAVSDVQRLRDQYLENRGRTEHANSAYLSSQSAAYAEIENVFAEPGDTALQAQMHDMWDSWGDVANNPQLPAARAALIQQSSTVADGLNYAHAALTDQWGQNRKELSVYANEVNTAAQSIAQLNESIVQAKATGLPVNELEDRRDLQVLSLSKLTGATASVRPNGAMDVFVGGSTLVSEFTARKLEVSGATRLDDQAVDPVTVRWADTKTRGRRRRHHGCDGGHADDRHPGPRQGPGCGGQGAGRHGQHRARRRVQQGRQHRPRLLRRYDRRNDQGRDHRPGQGRYGVRARHGRRLRGGHSWPAPAPRPTDRT